LGVDSDFGLKTERGKRKQIGTKEEMMWGGRREAKKGAKRRGEENSKI